MYAVFKLCTRKCRFQSGKLKTTSNGNNHMFNHNLTRLRNGSSNSILYMMYAYPDNISTV